MPKTCYCGLKSSNRICKYALIMPHLAYIYVKNVHKKRRGCCAFSSAITGRCRWMYVQGFDIRQQTACLKHDRSRSHISPYTTRIAFLVDSYIFCLNYPAILCIIQYKSPTTWMAHSCDLHVQKQKACVASNHACKINTLYTRTYPYKVSAMKQSSLKPVVP